MKKDCEELTYFKSIKWRRRMSNYIDIISSLATRKVRWSDGTCVFSKLTHRLRLNNYHSSRYKELLCSMRLHDALCYLVQITLSLCIHLIIILDRWFTFYASTKNQPLVEISYFRKLYAKRKREQEGERGKMLISIHYEAKC